MNATSHGLRRSRFVRLARFPARSMASPPLELAEDIVDCRARRKRPGRQISPRATCPQKIEDRVHRRAHVGLARSSPGVASGISAQAASIAHPSDRSAARSPIADKPRGGHASRSRIAFQNPERRRESHHDPHAHPFWVRLLVEIQRARWSGTPVPLRTLVDTVHDRAVHDEANSPELAAIKALDQATRG